MIMHDTIVRYGLSLRDQVQLVAHATGHLELVRSYQLAEEPTLPQAQDQVLHLEAHQQTGYQLAFLEGLADEARQLCEVLLVVGLGLVGEGSFGGEKSL